ERVFLSANPLKAPAQNTLEVSGGDQVGERTDAAGISAAFDESGRGGVDLIAAQAKGVRSQRPRTSVRRKRIAPRSPRQVIVNVLHERGRQTRPIDAFGRAAEGWHSHRLEPEQRLARRLVPDQRHLSVQRVRLSMQRSFANRGDEVINDVIVDLTWLDVMGARVSGKPREADLRPPA